MTFRFNIFIYHLFQFSVTHLSLEFEEQAMEWVDEKFPNFTPYLLKLEIKDEIFPPRMFVENLVKDIDGKKWWTIMSKHAEKLGDQNFVDFCQFLAKLHGAPASSASIERIFSTFSHIWSKLRNKLGAQKVGKLVKIYRHFNRKNMI